MSAILARTQHRRAFRRGVLVTCQVVREHDFRRVAQLGLDLSTEGMLVATRDVVLTGEELIVSFRAPLSNRWFDAQATVARVVHGRRPGDRGRCLGLSFHGNDESWAHEVFKQLRGLPPVHARRPGAFALAR
jgi:hypothetical protein